MFPRWIRPLKLMKSDVWRYVKPTSETSQSTMWATKEKLTGPRCTTVSTRCHHSTSPVWRRAWLGTWARSSTPTMELSPRSQWTNRPTRRSLSSTKPPCEKRRMRSAQLARSMSSYWRRGSSSILYLSTVSPINFQALSPPSMSQSATSIPSKPLPTCWTSVPRPGYKVRTPKVWVYIKRTSISTLVTCWARSSQRSTRLRRSLESWHWRCRELRPTTTSASLFSFTPSSQLV